MDVMETDRLIDDYLRRLEQAAAHLQRARRVELVGEIRGHIEAALREEQTAGEAAVRNVLDRLGSPEEIVEAAEPTAPPAQPRAGRLEIAALVALVVPLIGWLVGVVLVAASRFWSGRDKLVGALLLFLPVVLLGVGLALAGASGGEDSVPPGDTSPVGEKVEDPAAPGGVELVLFVAGVPSALFLAWQLRRGPQPSVTGS